MNITFLSGNLTADPEVRRHESGTVVAQFSLATNERYRNKQGESVEKVEFHRLTAFGSMAEFIERNFRKGSGMVAQARLQYGSYTDSEGRTRYTTSLMVEKVEFPPKS